MQYFQFQHSLSKIHTHLFVDKQNRKNILINPSFFEIKDLPLEQGYKTLILITEVNTDSCARLSQLKSMENTLLHAHASQLPLLQFLPWEASKKNLCGVFVPQVDHVFGGEKGQLEDWGVQFSLFGKNIVFCIDNIQV